MAAERAGNRQFGGSLGPRGLGKGGLLLPIIALSCLVFLAGLGRLPLFGRDEALYAEAAREMHASGDWITPRVNGVFFFEKPPLYYWLAALSYTVFGETPLAARLPAALTGILVVAATAMVTARVWGGRAALLAGLMLATCPLVVMVARMGIMDMPLTCLITLAMLAYARWRRRGGLAPPLAFGIFVGLGLLLKGLAGGLAPAIAATHALTERRKASGISVSSVALAAVLAVCVSAPWFLAMAHRHGEGYAAILFVREHLARMAQPMQGHGGGVYYYVALVAFAFFPWVAFLPAALRRRSANTSDLTPQPLSPGDPRLRSPSPVLERGPEGEASQSDDQAFWRSLAIVWLLVVLIPFSLIKTKLPGYVLPLFPPMAMLVAAELDRRLESPGRAAWIPTIALGALFSAAFALLPEFGARYGERYGASADARLLVLPAACWVGGYAASIVGAFHGLVGRARAALAFMVAGQGVVVASLLVGMLPVLSPYLGGGPAYLAQLSQRELPGRPIVLYETRPETVAFVLRRSVPVYSRNQESELLAEMSKGPTALIAPLSERSFWQSLPHGPSWVRGLDVLLDAHELGSTGRDHVTRDGGAHIEPGPRR